MSVRQVVNDVGKWVWGVAQGSFNEEQTVSQILVDAVIGMIPLVGDATAARDILAVVIRLANHPERRDEVLQWVELVIGLFALIPVAGGVIKGVAKIAVRAGRPGTDAAKLMAEAVEFVNRLGRGNGVAFVRKLDVLKYSDPIRAEFQKVTGRLIGVIASTQRRIGKIAPQRVLDTLQALKQGIAAIRPLGDRMIPQAIRELNDRLKLIQQQVYRGDLHEIPSSLRSRSREAEAGLVDVARSTAKAPAFPQNKLANYRHMPGWPDLRQGRHAQDNFQSIRAFSGPMKAVYIPPGTVLRRVINSANPAHARYWWLRQVPANGRRWREDYAVLESWGGDGEWIEFVVPKPGLRVWEGKCSSMTETTNAETMGQHLPGGGTQLLIDFEFEFNKHATRPVEALGRRKTGWTDLSGIGVPPRDTVAVRLTPNTRREKKGPTPTVARGDAAALRAASKPVTRNNRESEKQPPAKKK